jgi:hypothetical protein
MSVWGNLSVAEVLGHSSAEIAADLYSHTTEQNTRDVSGRSRWQWFG